MVMPPSKLESPPLASVAHWFTSVGVFIVKPLARDEVAVVRDGEPTSVALFEFPEVSVQVVPEPEYDAVRAASRLSTNMAGVHRTMTMPLPPAAPEPSKSPPPPPLPELAVAAVPAP